MKRVPSPVKPAEPLLSQSIPTQKDITVDDIKGCQEVKKSKNTYTSPVLQPLKDNSEVWPMPSLANGQSLILTEKG